MDPLRAQLIDAAARIACDLSLGQAEALALELELAGSPRRVRRIAGLPAPAAVLEMCDLWVRVGIHGRELADAIRCAARAVKTVTSYEKVELLYTGPGAESIRRNEQALLEVIRNARFRLWLVSYVVGQGADVVLDALAERCTAGVAVNVLIDHRTEGAQHGRRRIENGAPGCRIYVWPDDKREFEPGRFASLHAKCAVADGRQAFVSSANLTGWALDYNLEVGYLVTGGPTPATLGRYLDELVQSAVLAPARSARA